MPLLVAGAFNARYLKPGVPRKLLDRIGKRFPAVLHQKSHRRPVRAAAEAVIELLRGADGEGRRLFAVKRAARLVIRARFLERDVAIDDLNNIDAAQQRRNKIVWDHRLGCSPTHIGAECDRTEKSGRTDATHGRERSNYRLPCRARKGRSRRFLLPLVGPRSREAARKLKA